MPGRTLSTAMPAVRQYGLRMSDVPAHAVGPADRANGGFIYRVPTAGRSSDSETWHPEIAARVWATSRVAVLDTPTAKLTRGPRAGQNRFGALEMTKGKALALLVNGIIAFGLNVVSFTANKKSGPLTMTVAGACLLAVRAR